MSDDVVQFNYKQIFSIIPKVCLAARLKLDVHHVLAVQKLRGVTNKYSATIYVVL